jgi:hypothetical protein
MAGMIGLIGVSGFGLDNSDVIGHHFSKVPLSVLARRPNPSGSAM